MNIHYFSTRDHERIGFEIDFYYYFTNSLLTQCNSFDVTDVFFIRCP